MTTATSTSTEPTHHLTLYDGTTTYGLVLCDGHGVPSAHGIRRTPIQRSSLKFSQGESEYSDLEPPYNSTVQHDWSGGRGLENFDRDSSRFYDSWRAYTLNEGEILLGGQETYCTGHRDLNETAFTDVTWTPLIGNTKYLARKFTTTAAYTATYIYLWIRRIGTPTGDLTVGLYNDSTGDIGSAISGATATVDTDTITDKESVWRKFTLASPASLSDATAYWIRVHDAGTPGQFDYWQVATHATEIGDTEQSSDGSAWTDPASVGLYFRVTDADDDFKAHFFEYRAGLYMAKNEDDKGAGKLYINGDRGACDTGTSTQVNDATKSWTNDEWIGCIVKIVTGDASGDDPNWRYITDNDSNTLVVSPAWESTITDGSAGFGSEYVILGSNKWTEVTGHSWTDPIVDVAVADEVVYFATGEDYTDASRLIYSYRGGSNSSGVWVDGWSIIGKKSLGASFLKVIRNPVDGLQVWLARNECIEEGKRVSVQRFTAPSWGGYLDMPVLIDNCYDAWNESVNTDVTSTTFDGGKPLEPLNRGIKIVVNDLSSTLGAGEILATEVVSEFGSSDAIDIRHCKKVAVKIKSSIDLAAGDLQLLLDNTASCASAVHSLNFPYLRANIWTDAEMDISVSDADGSEAIISVGVNYVTDKTPNYTELLSNTGFETAGGGGADVFANWTEVAGSGTITRDTSEKHAGAASCKMVMGDASDDCKVHQTVTVVPGEWYIFQGWSYGDATEDAQYGIYDVTGSADIVAKTNTGDTAAAWAEVNKIFQAPADCVSARLDLWASDAAGTIYWDDVRIVKAEFQIDIASVFAIMDSEHIPVGDQTELITGLAAYGDPRTLWVFKESSIWSVTNDIPTEIPIEELRSVRSQENGKAHTINDVYLYFSLDGGRVERYYRDNLDDIGPTRDAGLPWERRGNINDLVTYPGMIIASVDGQAKETFYGTPFGSAVSQHSSVLAYRNGGWHELWRTEWARIRGLYIQSVPGLGYDRLWINAGTDILWIPLSLNPWDNENEYLFAHESSVVSAWNYVKMQDINKLFKSLKLVADRLSGTAQTVAVEYQTDDAVDTSTWNSVDDTDAPFNTSPTEELDFSTDSPPDVTGRRLRYRLRLLTTDNVKTPRVRATVLESVIRVPVKYQYEITFRVMDESLDLEGDDDDFTTAQTLTAKLDSWATANTPLTARFVFSPFDSVAGTATGRTVFIEPASLQPLYLIADDQLETHLGQCTLIEA